jgi:titin
VTVSDGVRTTTATIVSGLRNGTRYYFRVLATNAAGRGPSSNVANQTPRTVPTAPRTLTATPGSTRVVLRWTPPASTGGAPITRYAIQRSTNPTTGWVYLTTSIPPTTRAFTATNLRNGTRYYFRIVAINAAGLGPWSTPTNATPR